MISECLDCLACSSHCAPLWVAALGGWLPSVGLQFAFAFWISPGSVCRVLSLCLSRSLSALVLHIWLENLTLESFRHLYTFLFCIDIIHLVLWRAAQTLQPSSAKIHEVTASDGQTPCLCLHVRVMFFPLPKANPNHIESPTEIWSTNECPLHIVAL